MTVDAQGHVVVEKVGIDRTFEIPHRSKVIGLASPIRDRTMAKEAGVIVTGKSLETKVCVTRSPFDPGPGCGLRKCFPVQTRLGRVRVGFAAWLTVALSRELLMKFQAVLFYHEGVPSAVGVHHLC